MNYAHGWIERAWDFRHTLRARLTLWYVVLLAVMLLALSGFLYVNLSRNLHADIDRLLAVRASEMLAAMDTSTNPPRLDRALRELPTDSTAALYSSDGRELLADDPHRPLPLQPSTIKQAVGGHESVTTVDLRGGEWRVLTQPVVLNGQIVAVLQVAQSEERIEVALGQLLRLLFIADPVTLLLAVGGGLFLANRALDPIERITRTADQIGAEDLSRRLGLTRQRDEVGRLAATFDRMLTRLDRAFQRQRQFTADASHELRTPLAVLMSQADVALERRRPSVEYRQVLFSIREDAARMGDLLSQLLMLARADAGQEALAIEPIALDELAHDVVGAMKPLASGREVTLECETNGELRVSGDQTRLTQLLMNLVDNALKHTLPGGSVIVSTARNGGWAELRVVDSGVGIEARHLPHLFERFYRVDKARSREEGGTGLGLAISQWIAEAHGGSISVDSAPGRGSTFAVHIPMHDPGQDRTRTGNRSEKSGRRLSPPRLRSSHSRSRW